MTMAEQTDGAAATRTAGASETRPTSPGPTESTPSRGPGPTPLPTRGSKTLRLLVAALDARGIPYERFGAAAMAARGAGAQPAVGFVVDDVHVFVTSYVRVYVADERSPNDPKPRLLNGLASKLFKDKSLTSAIVGGAGLPTPAQYKIADGERVNLRHVFKGLSAAAPQGLVVKPNRGRHGTHVYLAITTLPAFREAVTAAMTVGGAVVVEPMVPGRVFRFFVVDGSVVAVRYGVSDSGHSNRHQGARVIDATSLLHASYRGVAEHAVARFPGTFVAGVDVAVPDPAVPARLGPEPNCYVIELNGAPGFITHHVPDEGESVDVAGRIVEALLARFAAEVPVGPAVRP